MTTPAWDALRLSPTDDVAVALRPINSGETARIRAGDEPLTLAVRASIPMAHKIALRGIAAGAPVRKYGEVIGEARAAIAAGDHVHVHNLVSCRARKTA
jgi:altronate dehydratase small subunit